MTGKHNKKLVMKYDRGDVIIYRNSIGLFDGVRFRAQVHPELTQVRMESEPIDLHEGYQIYRHLLKHRPRIEKFISMAMNGTNAVINIDRAPIELVWSIDDKRFFKRMEYHQRSATAKLIRRHGMMEAVRKIREFAKCKLVGAVAIGTSFNYGMPEIVINKCMMIKLVLNEERPKWKVSQINSDETALDHVTTTLDIDKAIDTVKKTLLARYLQCAEAK